MLSLFPWTSLCKFNLFLFINILFHFFLSGHYVSCYWLCIILTKEFLAKPCYCTSLYSHCQERRYIWLLSRLSCKWVSALDEVMLRMPCISFNCRKTPWAKSPYAPVQVETCTVFEVGKSCPGTVCAPAAISDFALSAGQWWYPFIHCEFHLTYRECNTQFFYRWVSFPSHCDVSIHLINHLLNELQLLKVIHR